VELARTWSIRVKRARVAARFASPRLPYPALYVAERAGVAPMASNSTLFSLLALCAREPDGRAGYDLRWIWLALIDGAEGLNQKLLIFPDAAASASSTLSTFGPPPWASSGLPPPRPSSMSQASARS
jgi:hypothetical protein